MKVGADGKLDLPPAAPSSDWAAMDGGADDGSWGGEAAMNIGVWANECASCLLSVYTATHDAAKVRAR